jgi:O-antigen ligase
VVSLNAAFPLLISITVTECCSFMHSISASSNSPRGNFSKSSNSLAYSFASLLALLPIAHVRGAQSTMIGACLLLFMFQLWQRRAFFCVSMPSIITLPLLAWICWATISCWWATDFWKALQQVGESVFLPSGMLLVGHYLGRQERYRIFLLAGICVGVTALCVVSLAAIVVGKVELLKTGGAVGLSSDPVFRWYPGPGLTSTFALFALPVIYGAMRERSFSTWSNLLIIGLIFVGVATFNRMFLITIPVLGIVLYVAGLSNENISRCLPWLIAGGVALLAVGAVVIPVSYSFRFSGEFVLPTWETVKQTVTRDPRIAIWNLWLTLGAAHAPLFGTGFGKETARHAYAQYLASAVNLEGLDGAAATHPHNFLISTWIQTGVVGLLCFVSLFWGAIAISWRLAKAEGTRNIGGALVGLVCVFFVKNMTDDFYDRVPAVYFWSCFGMMLGWGMDVFERQQQSVCDRS